VIGLFSPLNDISPLGLTVMLAGLCLASLARGYSGFGFSAVLIASWSLVTDPAKAIAVTVLLEIVASIIQAFSVWKSIPWKRVLLLMGGAAPGMLLGIIVLTSLPVDMLKLILAIFVLVAAGLLSVGWKLKARANDLGTFAVGVASGIVNGSIGMGGLPVALFLTADGDSPAKSRAAVVAYFFLLDMLGLILFSQIGIISADTFSLAILSFPVLLIGMFLGTRHFLGATPEGFRRVTLIMLMGIAVIGTVRSLLS
jgi:uncharacterized membrane protein YfcA